MEGTSTSEKTSHIYRNPGEYLITLTVDDGMASSTATTTIKILSPPFLHLPAVLFILGKKRKFQRKKK